MKSFCLFLILGLIFISFIENSEASLCTSSCSGGVAAFRAFCNTLGPNNAACFAVANTPHWMGVGACIAWCKSRSY